MTDIFNKRANAVLKMANGRQKGKLFLQLIDDMRTEVREKNRIPAHPGPRQDDEMSELPFEKVKWYTWSRKLSLDDQELLVQFLLHMKTKLAEVGCLLAIYVQPQRDRDDVVWGDFGTDSLSDDFDYHLYEANIPWVIFEPRYIESEHTFQNIIGNMCLQHSDFSFLFLDVMNQTLGQNLLKWNGDPGRAVCVG